MMNHKKYRRIEGPKLKNRTWPDQTIEKTPIWCSVDLRDGNQALDTPMNLEEKIEYFSHLLKIGFKEIEIGFPSASDTEFAFCRHLITQKLIPDDIAIQVLTPARLFLIDHTFEAVKGAKNVIIHLYLPTSPVQRNVVLNMSKRDVIEMAVRAAMRIKQLAASDIYKDMNVIYQFSPESFMATEADYAVEICDAVLSVWKPTADQKAIINLPNTVELTPANIYADMIEYFAQHTKWRNEIILSVHTHNDRGGAVTASELGLQAGAERVEGTLFGNGERTGNCDLVTMALNLLMSGVDPGLDFSQIDESVKLYERLTNMDVPPRQAYAGELVYTAFSGSHQDAIRKGMANQDPEKIWQVPYLPLDPRDVGREYDPIIRINSQSGRSGITFIFEQFFGIVLPKFIQARVSTCIKQESERLNKELTTNDLHAYFYECFVNQMEPLKLNHFVEEMLDDKQSHLTVELHYKHQEIRGVGTGSGVVEALCRILGDLIGQAIEVINYNQHALDRSSSSRGLSYIEITCNGDSYFGVGESSSSTKSSLRALISAVNSLLASQSKLANKLTVEAKKQ